MTEFDELPMDTVREGVRLIELGKEHASRAENRKAIQCYKQAMDISAPDPVLWNWIGECYLHLNERDKCIEALRTAISLDPEDEQALHNLSLVLLEHDAEEAEQVARRAIDVEESLWGNWRNLGRALYLQGRYPEAVQVLATSIGLNPDDEGVHYFMAMGRWRMGELEEAHRSFLRSMELRDDEPRVLTDFGEFLFEAKLLDEAETYLRRAVKEDPYNGDASAILADVMLERTKDLHHDPDRASDLYGQAMKILNEALCYDVANARVWCIWGKICYIQHEYEQAEKYLRAAIEGDCEDIWAWALLSATLGKLGRDKEASEAFEEFRRLQDIRYPYWRSDDSEH